MSKNGAAAQPECSCTCEVWRRVASPSGPFVEYRLDLRCGDMAWSTWRRFSAFSELRKQLKGLANAKKPLPHKNMRRHTVSPEDLKKRAPALAEWLNGVLVDDGAMASMAVLEFVGLAASAMGGPSRERTPVHVSMLPQIAETGDIMLFRTKAVVPMLQRAVTQSNWDHVGVVVHFDWRGDVCNSIKSAECGMIECDMAGTRFYGLQQYESYQWHLQYEKMALRQLQWEERGGAAVTRTMQAWYDEVKDKPYSLSIAKVVGTSDLKQQSAELKHKNFFCSELVAYAYQRLGVLSTQQAACEYWPVSFGEAANLTLERDATLGEEIPIDFATPGVATVREVPHDRRANSRDRLPRPEATEGSAVAAEAAESAGAPGEEGGSGRSGCSVRRSVSGGDDVTSETELILESSDDDADELAEEGTRPPFRIAT